VLKFAENPRGRIAGFRALQLVAGVGPASAGKILGALESAPDPATAVRGCAVAAEGWDAFVQLLCALWHGGHWPGELDAVLHWYEPQLERMYEDAASRSADLAQLKAIGATYASRESFLTELTLDPPSAISDEAHGARTDDDYLILSTIHSAKGQEWKAVHILNAVDGCIPSDMATGTAEEIEEERRLLYVAMTRAKDHLRVMVPQRFYVHQQSAHGDRYVHASRSRFLSDTVAQRCACMSWPQIGEGVPTRAAQPTSKVDIAARVRAAWR